MRRFFSTFNDRFEKQKSVVKCLVAGRWQYEKGSKKEKKVVFASFVELFSHYMYECVAVYVCVFERRSETLTVRWSDVKKKLNTLYKTSVEGKKVTPLAIQQRKQPQHTTKWKQQNYIEHGSR